MPASFSFCSSIAHQHARRKKSDLPLSLWKKIVYTIFNFTLLPKWGIFIMEQEDRNLQAQQPEKQPQPKGYEAYLSLFDLVRMLAVITLVFVFFFRLNGVSGSSMYPTLVDKDYLVLESNFLYRDAKQGDIVVLYTPPFSENDELLVKRVIAVGGQTVDIDFDAGVVYVDGQALDEPYTFEPTYLSYAEYGKALEYPVTVPEGELFVMGDNRNHSEDSRFSDVGCVKKESVLGKVLLVVFPGRQTNEYGAVTGGRSWHRFGAVS